ncbi:hypothetical protein FCR2A7T_23390 [Flavobacterium cauense R2A-7]|uniref:Uncharacterized protein n=1 Tax=Flavobacterium cauense R2A-7 TaxID=1341154 RepID=V6RWT0_9FLAO|nr:hypothetical protein [Flavobacterium cauense]ESU18933.1 hypothetical protein FCR2A7T_23390 [Flavobacterium cauense R2A-7]TWI15408.1 hypothetical protein IP98_00401 [Flavobacterium cauense R2A-7]
MKKIILSALIAITLSGIYSCSNDSDSKEATTNVSSNRIDDIKPNKEYISKIILSIAETAEFIKQNEGRQFSQEDINIYVKERLQVNGAPVSYEPIRPANCSERFYTEAALIANASVFEDEFKYFDFLNKKENEIINSDLSLEEKQVLVEEIEFQRQLVNAISALDTKYNGTVAKGWWKGWGKCVSSILGGAVTGATTLGLAGAAVGTVALPVVGTVSAGAVGAIGGGIGGALTGAAAGC